MNLYDINKERYKNARPLIRTLDAEREMENSIYKYIENIMIHYVALMGVPAEGLGRYVTIFDLRGDKRAAAKEMVDFMFRDLPEELVDWYVEEDKSALAFWTNKGVYMLFDYTKGVVQL